MNIKRSVVTGLMGLTTLAPCKAQKVMLAPEVGVSGALKKEMSCYGGLNVQFPRAKSFSDLYGGVSVNPDKKASFVGLAIHDQTWHQNVCHPNFKVDVGSWGRETFIASNRNTNSILEIAPVRVKTSTGKVSFSLNPSYALYNDFREGTTTHGINTIVQATYSTPSYTLWGEAKYSSEPAQNICNTLFGNVKDNLSYMLSCIIPL